MAKHSERRGDRKIIQLKDHLSQREAPPQEPETDQAPDQEAPEEDEYKRQTLRGLQGP